MKMNVITCPETIRVEGVGGSSVYDAIARSIVLAQELNTTVILTFNGHTITLTRHTDPQVGAAIYWQEVGKDSVRGE